MKNLIYLILLVSSSLTAFGQKEKDISLKRKPDEYKKYIKHVGVWTFDIRNATPKQLEEIKIMERLKSIANDRFVFSGGAVLAGANQTIAVRFQQNTNAKVYDGNDFTWGERNYYKNYIIAGDAAIEFADVGITKESAKNYRYHLLANDNKELVGWTIPHVFKKTTDGKATYAYLGSYPRQFNGYIKIEIYNIFNYSDRTAIMIDWRPVTKAVINVGVEYTIKNRSGGPFYASLDSLKAEKYYNIIGTTSLNDKKFFLSDSLVRLNIQLKKTSFNYKVQLIKKSKDKSEKFELGNYDNSFFIYKEFWKDPGEYQLLLTPSLPSPGGTPVYYLTDKLTSYKFTVLPEKNKVKLFSAKELIISGILLSLLAGGITGALTIYLKNKQAKTKIAEQAKQREIAQLQLNSVRSQLNPHFLFNALAGIQNLINKNEVDNANRYLSKFARLTRNVLDSKELISLAEEKELLDDYLQMEQLRFGFQYIINESVDLDTENIEIPTMLLQPFVENAVKHAITEKSREGKIEVGFEKQSSDLVLKISDNGKGFNATKTYEGLGLTLSKNRISLLNTIYKNTPFVLDIQSDMYGTVITITLTQWL